MNAVALLTALLAGAVLSSPMAHAQQRPGATFPAAVEAPGDRRATLGRARSWGYLLQNVSAKALLATSYDLLVVDAGTPAPGSTLSRAQIAQLKRKPDGHRRLVVAYLNIGEAEDYRYYWKPEWTKSPPDWLGSQNCRWKGDHRVRFWRDGWQRIIFGSPDSYLGRIIALGYDGVWLDRVDIHNAFASEHPAAFADMVRLVSGLSAWAKTRNAGFLVLPQNGEELTADPAYRAAIDGQGKEDLFYGDQGNGIENTPDRISRAAGFLKPLPEAGIALFAVEYLKSAGQIPEATERLRAVGAIPYFGPRSLSRLGLSAGSHPEDGDTEPVKSGGAHGC